MDPATTEDASTMFRVGKAWSESAEPAGQEVIKEAAKVTIWRALIATSNAWGIGCSLSAVLMNV